MEQDAQKALDKAKRQAVVLMQSLTDQVESEGGDDGEMAITLMTVPAIAFGLAAIAVTTIMRAKGVNDTPRGNELTPENIMDEMAEFAENYVVETMSGRIDEIIATARDALKKRGNG